jgi:hypothetical protein
VQGLGQRHGHIRQPIEQRQSPLAALDHRTLVGDVGGGVDGNRSGQILDGAVKHELQYANMVAGYQYAKVKKFGIDLPAPSAPRATLRF